MKTTWGGTGRHKLARNLIFVMFNLTNPREVGQEEAEGLLSEVKEPTSLAKKEGNHRWTLKCLSGISISLNLLFLSFGLLRPQYERNGWPSYESGFTLDLGMLLTTYVKTCVDLTACLLGPVKSEIELIEKPFSGGIRLDSNGSFSTDSGGQEYVGTPSPTIDRAWALLLSGLNFDLSQEAANLAGKTFQWQDSGFYFSGLEVYHSLHCLVCSCLFVHKPPKDVVAKYLLQNRLRQALYPEYYSHVFNSLTAPAREDHIGHCINHIRQALQCHSDLTPMEWRLDGNKIILKTDTLHTCRNFDKIHSWASARRTKYESVESLKNGSLVIVD
ncbi:hypothetical protein F5884DRAFT_139970 [Xylogone sp. PMI_703]|nr:hypothetical protein F5884DRAFT_139970 [Xylogone sp. PMI_703]